MNLNICFCKKIYCGPSFGHILTFSVTKVLSGEVMRGKAISQWGWSETMQGKCDPGAGEGKVQQGSGLLGGWEEVEVYIREKTSGKPQRQSVSQTATTPTASRCPAISRRQPVKETPSSMKKILSGVARICWPFFTKQQLLTS